MAPLSYLKHCVKGSLHHIIKTKKPKIICLIVGARVPPFIRKGLLQNMYSEERGKSLLQYGVPAGRLSVSPIATTKQGRQENKMRKKETPTMWQKPPPEAASPIPKCGCRLAHAIVALQAYCLNLVSCPHSNRDLKSNQQKKRKSIRRRRRKEFEKRTKK